MKPQVRIFIGGAVIAGAFGALLFSGTQNGTLSSVPVADLRKADGTPHSYVGQRLRAVGFVTRQPVRQVAMQTAAGTVNVNHFVIDDKGKTVQVQFADVLPNSFRLGGPVQIDGKYTAPGYIDADRVLTKCPSKYDATAKQQDNYRGKESVKPSNPQERTASRVTNAVGS